MPRKQWLVTTGKDDVTNRRADLIKEVLEFLGRQLPGRPLEDRFVAEMAHHAAEIALVDDIEAESQSRTLA
jgi:hypothetical protein